MKKTIFILILMSASIAMFAQTDSIFNLKVEYKYEKIGNGHYFTTITTNPDSSQYVTRSKPYKTKKEVTDFAQSRINQSNSLEAKIDEEIIRKQEYLKNLQEQAVQLANNLNQEINNVRQQLRTLRTERKLTKDSKTTLKEVK